MFSKRHVAVLFAITIFGCLLAASPINAFYASIDFDQREFAREEQNLAAQWGIQTANEAMVRLTGWQIALSALTIAGLMTTLVMNNAALKQSDRMLQHARSVAEHELRAYVAIEKFSLTKLENGKWKFAAQVTNRGRTPATNVEIRAMVIYLAGDFKHAPWPKDLIENAESHYATIQPEGMWKPQRQITLSSAQIDQISRKNGGVHAVACVRYSGVFGHRYERTAGVVFFGQGLQNQWPVQGQNDEIILHSPLP